ncbi:MAG: hypothetical protein H6Q42_610 [Deltaproteobacteria bacterium]|nr:hypothetical protein [Deltaproteobacteria bacterium]
MVLFLSPGYHLPANPSQELFGVVSIGNRAFILIFITVQAFHCFP